MTYDPRNQNGKGQHVPEADESEQNTLARGEEDDLILPAYPGRADLTWAERRVMRTLLNPKLHELHETERIAASGVGRTRYYEKSAARIGLERSSSIPERLPSHRQLAAISVHFDSAAIRWFLLAITAPRR